MDLPPPPAQGACQPLSAAACLLHFSRKLTLGVWGKEQRKANLWLTADGSFLLDSFIWLWKGGNAQNEIPVIRGYPMGILRLNLEEMAERQPIKVFRTLTPERQASTPPSGVRAQSFPDASISQGLSEPRPCAGWVLNTLISLNSEHEAKSRCRRGNRDLEKRRSCLGGLETDSWATGTRAARAFNPPDPSSWAACPSCDQMTVMY